MGLRRLAVGATCAVAAVGTVWGVGNHNNNKADKAGEELQRAMLEQGVSVPVGRMAIGRCRPVKLQRVPLTSGGNRYLLRPWGDTEVDGVQLEGIPGSQATARANDYHLPESAGGVVRMLLADADSAAAGQLAVQVCRTGGSTSERVNFKVMFPEDGVDRDDILVVAPAAPPSPGN